MTAKAGCPDWSERSRDSCASKKRSAPIEKRRAVSPIGSRVRSHVGRSSRTAASETTASPGSYQPKYPCNPSPGRKVPYRIACAPSAQTAAGRSRTGTQEAYPSAVERNAADVLTDPPPPLADARIAYGPEPLQFGDLRNASGDALAVVLHGGVWKAMYNLIHTGHLCGVLRDAGIATFNVEYRRVGDLGGGWPGSFEDVLLAVEHARGLAGRLVLVGHSAGGHLALLAARRLRLPVVALAAVTDPATWANDGVRAFFGGDPPAEGSPLAQLPLGARQMLIHGTRDEVVPFEQSQRYADAAGDEAELIPLEGAGHFEPIDALSPESAVVVHAVERLLG
jgi:acetyl esterase/lipase